MTDPSKLALARLYVEAMDAEARALAQRLTACVQPTFVADDGGRPFRVGSCVYVELDGCYFAVTAGHVLNQSPSRPVYVGPVGGKLVMLPSAFHFFTQPIAPGLGDRLDIGAAVIPATRVADLKGCFFVRESMMASVEEPSPERRPLREYLIFGYPASRSQSRVFQKKIDLTSFRFATSAAVSARYSEVRVNPRSHVLLDYEHDSVHVDGVPTTPPKLKGVSGGGIFQFRLGEEAKLVAIPTDHLKSAKLVLAVRIEQVKAFLRNVIHGQETWIFRGRAD